MYKLSSLRRVTSGSSYLPTIDGLRFFAIMPVVLWHLNSRAWRAYSVSGNGDGHALFGILNDWLGAKTGVELFFVISGFILALPFVRANVLQKPAPSLIAFYKRRLTRLEPPYILATLGAFFFLMVTTGEAGSALAQKNGFTLIDSLVASLLYLHGPVLSTLPQIIPVSWSLEIEFQFYMVAPFIFFSLLFLKNDKLRIIVSVLAVLFFVVLINPIQSHIGELIRFLLFRYLHFFLLGLVICQYFVKHDTLLSEPKKSVAADFLFFAALILLLLTETMMSDYRRQTPVHLELVRVGAFAVLFVSAFYGQWVASFLRNPFVTFIGGMCYSIYLIHLPIQQALIPKIVDVFDFSHFASALAFAFAISFPITLLAATAFYILIERPCMYPDWPVRFKRAMAKYVGFKA